MNGRSNLAGRVAVMERHGAAGRVVFAIRREGEPAEAAMRRTFGTQGLPHGARVVLVVTGIERADDVGAEP
jgi:hypothetical protein